MAKKITDPTPVKPASPVRTPKAKARGTKVAPQAKLKKALVGRRPLSKVSGVSEADVALRAYYLAEKRQTTGLPGNSHQDWLEAERQLAAEDRKKKPAPTHPFDHE